MTGKELNKLFLTKEELVKKLTQNEYKIKELESIIKEHKEKDIMIIQFFVKNISKKKMFKIFENILKEKDEKFILWQNLINDELCRYYPE